MKITHTSNWRHCRLAFDGKMTHEFSVEMEDEIINLMRRHSYLKIDLSAVCEIDSYGILLIDVLQCLTGKAVEIEATSPVVAMALANRASSESSRKNIDKILPFEKALTRMPSFESWANLCRIARGSGQLVR